MLGKILFHMTKTIGYLFLSGCIAEAISIVYSERATYVIWHLSLMIIITITSQVIRSIIFKSDALTRENTICLVLLKGFTMACVIERWTASATTTGIIWSVVFGVLAYSQSCEWYRISKNSS